MTQTSHVVRLGGGIKGQWRRATFEGHTTQTSPNGVRIEAISESRLCNRLADSRDHDPNDLINPEITHMPLTTLPWVPEVDRLITLKYKSSSLVEYVSEASA